jgi:hypothetical protein
VKSIRAVPPGGYLNIVFNAAAKASGFGLDRVVTGYQKVDQVAAIVLTWNSTDDGRTPVRGTHGCARNGGAAGSLMIPVIFPVLICAVTGPQIAINARKIKQSNLSAVLPEKG